MADSPSLPWQSSGVLASKSTGELANSMWGQNGMWMCDMCVRLAATTITQFMTPYLNSKIPRQLTWPSKFCQRLAAAACHLCRQFQSKLRLDMSGHLAELISEPVAQTKDKRHTNNRNYAN